MNIFKTRFLFFSFVVERAHESISEHEEESKRHEGAENNDEHLVHAGEPVVEFFRHDNNVVDDLEVGVHSDSGVLHALRLLVVLVEVDIDQNVDDELDADVNNVQQTVVEQILGDRAALPTCSLFGLLEEVVEGLLLSLGHDFRCLLL